MRLLVLTLSLSAFVLTACEIEPSKSEKEAMELKEQLAKTKATPPKHLPDPSKPDSNIEISLFEDVKRAEIFGTRGDVTGALKSLEAALKKNPNDRDVLRLMTRATQQRGQELKRPESSSYFLRSAETARKLISEYPRLSQEEAIYFPVVFYNAACTHAVNGEPDLAIKALGEAIKIGFRDLNQIETDTELESLRGRSEYAAVIRQIEEALIDGGLAAKYPFTFAFELPDSDGKIVKLDDFKGNVLMVTFWGSSYAASRKEVPHLIDLDKKYRDKHLRIVGINKEAGESETAKAAVATFAKENQIPFPCLVGDDATVKQVIDFKGFPTTLFIGPDGKVRLKLNGYQTLSSLELATTKLLDELNKPK